jgi:hypothetical protein
VKLDGRADLGKSGVFHLDYIPVLGSHFSRERA